MSEIGEIMQQPQDQYEKASQEYAREWMKSLERPRYSTNIGIFFIFIFLFIWTSTLTNQLGYAPFQGIGILVFLGIGIALGLGCYITNIFLSKIGFPKSIRSAIWFSALVGSYTGIVAINNWENPVLSHISGVASALISFILSYGLDLIFEHRIKSSG